jgi:hypothetical protein
LDVVRRFERMVASREPVFFDLETSRTSLTTLPMLSLTKPCERRDPGPVILLDRLLIDRAQVTAMRGDYTETERQIDAVAALDRK